MNLDRDWLFVGSRGLQPIPLTPREVALSAVAAAARRNGVSAQDVTGRRKTKAIARARREAIILVNTAVPAWGPVALGRLFNRNPSSISHVLGRLSRRRVSRET